MALASHAPMAILDEMTIRDLALFAAGIDLVVGLVLRPMPGRIRSEPDSRSVLVGQLVLGLDVGADPRQRPDVVDVIRCDGDHSDIREARRRARRSGAKTCVSLSCHTPLPALLRQLHEGHEFVLVAWDPEMSDRFLSGLTTLAAETRTTVIADNLGDMGQVRRAVAAGVTMGVVSSDLRPPPQEHPWA